MTARQRQQVLSLLMMCLRWYNAPAEGLEPGMEAMDDPIAPPPGLYYVGYLVNYRINEFEMPGSSQKLPGDNRSTITAQMNRLLWMTEKKVLGADYGMEALVPIINTSVRLGMFNVHAQSTGVGDIYLSPMILGWHGPRWDALIGTGMWLDNGRSGQLAAPGSGYKRLDLSAGLNAYLDEQKSISTSALVRFERNGKDNAGFRNGNQLFLDWSANKRFGPVQVGVTGYSQWQISDDSGFGASTNHLTRHAIGGQISYIFLESKMLIKAAAYKEVHVDAGTTFQPKGNMFKLTLAKAF